MTYRTIRVRSDGAVSHLQIHRPEANNTINSELIAECCDALTAIERDATVLVLEGLPEVFCFGADFSGIRDAYVASEAPVDTEAEAEAEATAGAAELYDLWQRIATGPFISIAHVRGQANAGGVGFVAACDIVIADQTARFSLSELLFGLYPACVLPFLARRIGLQRANYMTVTTQPIDVEQAASWGLVDAWHTKSEGLLHRQLLRLRRLSRLSVAHYKSYVGKLGASLGATRSLAIQNNESMNQLPGVAEGIARYVETGRFPWEP